MIKKLVSILSLLYGVLSANATVQYMTVEQQSGEKYSFLQKDNPVITYEDGNLVIVDDATIELKNASVRAKVLLVSVNSTVKSATTSEANDMARVMFTRK